MPDCPSDTDLSGFLDESLPKERLADVSGHVDGCAACQSRLDRLTDGNGGAVARYKELSSAGMPDARSGAIAGTPDGDTQIIGARPVAATLVGLPRVPGFEVAAEIGRGGMGVVYRARHRRLNRLVALKMVLAGAAADAVVVQRFLFEAEVLARVQHPQVVQVFEVGTYQAPGGVPIPFLAMELLEGGSLSGRLRDGPLSPRAAAELAEGLARAVHAAHLQGVVHRDLKPGNILFTNADCGIRNAESKAQTGSQAAPDNSAARNPQSAILPKVTDFGLAKFTQDAGADLTQSGQIVGTPQYMAPEQAAGGRQLGPAADVYALGAILYECLTGQPPFTGPEPMSVLLKVVNDAPKDVRSLKPDVPRDLAAVAMKCLEKEPPRRYASAEALADDLRRFLDDRPTVARPASNVERLRLWARRNPAVASLVATLATVLVAAFVTVAGLWVRAEGKADDERRAKTLSELSEQRARESAAHAEEALAESRRQKGLADLREARLEFRRAVSTCEQGEVTTGMALFLRALELAEANGDADLARVVRVNLAAWAPELPPARRTFRHGPQPRGVAFTPDGKFMLAAGRSSTLHLWDAQTGEKVRAYDAPRRLFRNPLFPSVTFWAVAVSADGKTVAAGGSDGQVWVWDTDAEVPKAVFPVTASARADALPFSLADDSDGNVWSVAFAPDGTLWANDGRHALTRWDVTARPPKRLASLSPPPVKLLGAVVGARTYGELQSLVVSPDGSRVYTGDRAGVVREWDAAARKALRDWHLSGWVQDLALAPDGRTLAATGTNAVVYLIDLAAEGEVREIGLAGAYGSGVAFTPDGRFVLASDADGAVRVWHRDTLQPVGSPVRFAGELLRPRFRPTPAPAGPAVFEFAVPAGDSVHLSALPRATGQALPGGKYRVRGLDFSPAGDRLAVTADARLQVFDLRAGLPPLRLGAGHPPLTLRFDPAAGRERLARGHRDGWEVVNLPKGDRRQLVGVGSGRIAKLEFLPGGERVVMHNRSVVSLWDAAALKELRLIPPEPNPNGVELKALAVRPDGGEVLVSYANRVIVLDSADLGVRRKWETPDEVLDARYLPGGKTVLLSRRDKTAQLHDAESGRPIGPPLTHDGAVPAVAVGPDGALLLTGSRDGTARFWDAATSLPLGPPLRHPGPVEVVAYSPVGDRVATGTATGQATLWEPPPPPAAGTRDELRANWPRRE